MRCHKTARWALVIKNVPIQAAKLGVLTLVIGNDAKLHRPSREER
jgi:hypothetical protein